MNFYLHALEPLHDNYRDTSQVLLRNGGHLFFPQLVKESWTL